MIAIPRLPGPYQPGRSAVNYLDDVDAMLATEFAPPDRYFTVSALLGRLRDPLRLPPPPHGPRAPVVPPREEDGAAGPEGGEAARRRQSAALEKQRALNRLDRDERYHREHPNTVQLLALYKKIASHKTALVFRKPVNPAEGASRSTQ